MVELPARSDVSHFLTKTFCFQQSLVCLQLTVQYDSCYSKYLPE